MEIDKLTNFINQFEELTKKPEKYISSQEDQAELIKLLIRDLYNFTKQNENVKYKNSETLEELIITDLDEEQIWQQIELQNNFIYDSLITDVAHFLAKKNSLKFPIKEKKNEEPSLKENTDFNENEEKVDVHSKKKKKIKYRTPKQQSVVDDKFFKLHEMEQFLEEIERGEETNENDDDDALINYFEDDLPNEDGSDTAEINQLHYNDFFDQPNDEDVFPEADEGKAIKKVRFSATDENDKNDKGSEENSDEFESDVIDEEDDSEQYNFNEIKNSDNEYCDDEDGNKNESESETESEAENSKNSKKNENITLNSKHTSTFEARQERLKLRIQNLEEEALKEKPWQLKGEVTASSRPQNSLLEEYVEFDTATRPAPVLTEKSTLKLEDVIIQRIKDKAWDDVVRKIKPVENDFEFKKKLVLDQEKSKLSLAQIYEQEYLKQLDAKNENGLEKIEIEPPEHREIKALMNKLFYKLDALSNFHFTPKQVLPEVKIMSNLPAVSMEEVAPVATSDATLLAPEEIKPKSKGDLIGKSERTATDKKRERRQKKLKQKLKYKQMEAKAKMKLETSDAKSSDSKKISEKLLQKITKSRNVIQLKENKDDKYIKSSNTFFSKLQNEAIGKVNKKEHNLKKAKLTKVSVKKSKTR